MFARHKAAKAQAQRDAEWRALVRAVAEPGQVASESDEVRFRAVVAGQIHGAAPPLADAAQLGARTRLTGPKARRSPLGGAPALEGVDGLAERGPQS